MVVDLPLSFCFPVSLVVIALCLVGCGKPDGNSRVGFLHGVASGDPLPNAIVLWTRVTPPDESKPDLLKVQWSIWEEQQGPHTPVVTGEIDAIAQHDFTVKTDVARGLRPSVRYEYQFHCENVSSPVGRFHLPPAAGDHLDHLTYAIFSCSNWRWGYFGAYGVAAEEPLDFWIHLGDFIYENGPNHYPLAVEQVRGDVRPYHKTVSLEDYRLRYASHRTDPDLQRLSASAPVIAVWDDHEVANDNWAHLAEGHNPKTDGSYNARKRAAMKAYHEWMPTRASAYPEVIPSINSSVRGSLSDFPWMQWRRFDFGNLATLMALETRLTSRDHQPFNGADPKQRIDDLLRGAGYPAPDAWKYSRLDQQLRDLSAELEAARRRPDNRMLGKDQIAWMHQQVQKSIATGTSWRLVASSLVMQEQLPPDLEVAISRANESQDSLEAALRWSGEMKSLLESPHRDQVLLLIAAGRYKINLSLDDWMGFVAERDHVAAALGAAAPGTNVVYAGDSHNAWAGWVRNSSGALAALEFDGMSVSSPGLEKYYPFMPSDFMTASCQAANQDLHWANTRDRGLMLVHLNRSTHIIDYLSVDTTKPWDGSVECLASFSVSGGLSTPHRMPCQVASFVESGAKPPSPQRQFRRHNHALLSKRLHP